MLNTPNGFGTIRSITYFCINNDFKYLHLNSNSSIFEILHSRFEDYERFQQGLVYCIQGIYKLC